MLSKEQRDWAAKFLGFDIAPQNDAADGQDTHAGTGGLEPGAVASSEDTGGSGRQADQAKRGDPKRSPAGGGKLTYHDVMVLTDNLAYLAQPQFRRATGKAGPPKLNLSATPAIAAPLEKAADAVRLWADPKTVPQAAKSWRAAEPALRAILREAAAEPLKVDAAALKPAYAAMDSILEFLSAMDVDANIQAAQDTMATPRLSEELDKREFAKLEPVLQAWQKVVGSGGQVVKGKSVDQLRQVIDAWYSSRDYEGKMRALEKAGVLGKNRMGTLDVADLSVKIAHMAISAAAEINEQAIGLATRQAKLGVVGAEEALHGLEGRAKLLEGVGGLAKALGLAISTYELVEGIIHGDWKKIASGAFGIGMGGLSIAAGEAAGGLLAGIEIAVWATAKAVLMGAETAHWFRKEQELEAFKRMARDARALIPTGMEMSAAWNLLVDSQDDHSGESLTENNRARYEQIAKADGQKLGRGLSALLDNHFHKKDKNAIGGYPEIVAPVLPMLRPAYAAVDYDNPGTLVDAFDATVKAVQAIMDAETKSNENTQVPDKTEE